MSFPDADSFNAVNGTHFIADLMPKTPVYVSLLPDSARAVMGQPHPTGRAALRMLQEEGMTFERYIDIFDGGPTVTAPTDQVRTIRESTAEKVVEVGEGGKVKVLLAAGRLRDFRAARAEIRRVGRKGIAITREVADLLEIGVGSTVLAAAR
jgi:arginine N-succinyltransferase